MKLTEAQESMELWRLGWDLSWNAECLKDWGDAFDGSWRDAVRKGMVPNEDVSPGESLWRLSAIVSSLQDAVDKECSDCPDCKDKKCMASGDKCRVKSWRLALGK